MRSMKRRDFLKTMALATGGALAAGLPWRAPGAGAQSARRPNILVILSDDIGWGDFHCYNPKSKIPSPNIDALARAGMRFTHAHTPAALCAPTRYSMLTGNYPWRGRSEPGSWGFNCPVHLLPEQQAVPALLKPAGYRTAMYGKQGFGGFYDTRRPGAVQANGEPLLPERLGLDYSFLIPRGHQSTPLAFFENGVVVGGINQNDEAPGWDHAKVGARLLEKAEFFLDDHLARNKAAGQDNPFFMHFCTDGAHSPYVPAEAIGGVPLKGVTKIDAHTDMVHEVDILVGKLVGLLEKRGLLENTVICFTSDNGGIPLERGAGHDAVGGLRGMKSFIFEGGTRVPFIVRWGDGTPDGSKIPPGTVRHQLVCTHDITATALELAGLGVPTGQCLDAVSLAPVLLGRQDDAKPVRRYLLVQSAPNHDATDDGGVTTPQSVIPRYPKVERTWAEPPSAIMAHALLEAQWKLVFGMNDKPAALYDVDADPGEQADLLARPEHAARIEEMTREYRRIRATLPHAPLDWRSAQAGKKAGKAAGRKGGGKGNLFRRAGRKKKNG